MVSVWAKTANKRQTGPFFYSRYAERANHGFHWCTGPLIAPFFLKGKLTKEKIIANKAICQAISHIGKMPIFILFFDFNYFSKMFVLVPMIIAVFVGANIGKQIIQIIPEIIFRALFKGTLTLIAFKLIADEVFPLF